MAPRNSHSTWTGVWFWPVESGTPCDAGAKPWSLTATKLVWPGASARRPIRFAPLSLNQMLPSAPTVMPLGSAFAVGMAYFLTVRGATTGMRATALPPVPLWQVTHMYSVPVSGPAVMPVGLPETLTWWTTPAVVMTATLLRPGSVTHRLPSGPETIREAAAPTGSGNLVTTFPGTV